jgi:ribA/ribD-fused uncharacterized protein
MEPNTKIIVGEGEYKFLSTFEMDGFKENNLHYNSVEHYFQSKKFEVTNPEAAKEIRESENSQEANVAGRTHKKMRPDWDSIKYEVMYNANYLKFSQNANLKEKLLRTGDVRIAQLSDQEFYWSENFEEKPKGRSLLGKILMEIRSKLKEN